MRSEGAGTSISAAVALSSQRSHPPAHSVDKMGRRKVATTTQSFDAWLGTSSILITATTRENDGSERVWGLFDLKTDPKGKKAAKDSKKNWTWADVRLDLPREWVPRSIFFRPGVSYEDAAYRKVALQALFEQTGLTVFELGHSPSM